MSTSESAYRFEPHPGSDIAFIGFAGFQLDKSVPDFSWGRAFSALPVNRLLIRDVVQFWYQRGLVGIAPDIAQSAVALREMLDSHGINRIVVVGASIGGFAAILYSSLLGADEVIAFAPMTRLPSRPLSQTARNLIHGRRALAGKQIGLRLSRDIDRRYCDLRPFLQNDNGRTRYRIYYGDQHVDDARNARYLADLPRVMLYARPYNTHDVVVAMRESGELAEVLSESMAHLSTPNNLTAH